MGLSFGIICFMDDYVRRVVDDELDSLLPALPAISLEGAKGVGKTTTALERAGSVFKLDDPTTLELVKADPNRMLKADEPVLIDEWQRFEPSWDLVRRAVDGDSRPGRFILTGSASPEVRATHSGAGRIVGVRMRPLSLHERWLEGQSSSISLTDILEGKKIEIEGSTKIVLEDYIEEIIVGGFPAIRKIKGQARQKMMDGYLERIVDTDFPEAGYTVRNPVALRKWMQAYAALTATDASYETIRDAATYNEGDKPSRTATKPYNDTLERLWLIDPVPAWAPTSNTFKRLVASSKHHLADPALAAALVRVSSSALIAGEETEPVVVRDGTLAGHLFESLIALNLKVYAQGADAKVYHCRTKAGIHEVDFIVERRDRKVLGIEVKLKKTVDNDDVKHLYWLREKLGDNLLDSIIITTGPVAYRRQDGIAVIPAALLGA